MNLVATSKYIRVKEVVESEFDNLSEPTDLRLIARSSHMKTREVAQILTGLGFKKRLIHVKGLVCSQKVQYMK